MKDITKRRRISTCRALLLLLALTSALYSQDSSTTHANNSGCPGNIVAVSYHSLGRSQIAIQVTINQRGPYEFMVDTGSQITVMEPSVAAELNLRPVGSVQVISGVRPAQAKLVSPDLIEVGPIAVHTAWAVVQSLEQFQVLYPELRGILGQDFLMGFDILIDRRKRILCLDATPEMRSEVRGERIALVKQMGKADATRTAHPIIVPVELTNDPAGKMNLRLDSGAGAPILYVNRVQQQSWSQRLRTQRGSIAGGSIMYFKILAPQDIQIGRHVINEVRFVAPIRSSQDVTFATEDGLLPTSLFKRIFISYRAGFVILEPH